METIQRRASLLLTLALLGVGACRSSRSPSADADARPDAGAADASPAEEPPRPAKRALPAAGPDAQPDTAPDATAVDAGGDASPCSAVRARFSPEQIATVMKMRADGDSLADVAKRVGATRAEIRKLEAAELARAGKRTHAFGAADPCRE